MAVHVVEKQVVELKLASEANSQELMRRVQPLFEDFVAEDLAQCLDQFDTGQVIQIDRLELDLGKIHIDRFDTELREAFRSQLTAYLKDRIRPLAEGQHIQSQEVDKVHEEDPAIQNIEQYYLSVWLFFMQNGHFSASFTGTFHTLYLHILEILESPSSSHQLKKRIFQFENDQQLARFIMHANDVLLYKAFCYLKDLPETFTEANWLSWKAFVLKLIHENTYGHTQEQLLQLFRQLVLKILSSPATQQIDMQGSETFWSTYMVDVLHNEPMVVSKDNVKEKNKKYSDTFMKNVGVVILGPYLMPFFQNLELVEQRQFTSLEAKEKAIKILCYLATGGFECTEDELTFFKLLCGHPQADPIDINIVLPSHFYEEAESLLESILEHWTVMKGSSNDALRETFLSRGGKLADQEEYWLLKVESKGVDILLDRVPWTFRTIKLPWMPKTLLVEWY